MLSRKNKGKIFYFDDEKSSFAAMVLWNNTQINLLSQNGIIERIYYHVQIQVFIQTHLDIFRDQSYTSIFKGT